MEYCKGELLPLYLNVNHPLVNCYNMNPVTFLECHVSDQLLWLLKWATLIFKEWFVWMVECVGFPFSFQNMWLKLPWKWNWPCLANMQYEANTRWLELCLFLFPFWPELLFHILYSKIPLHYFPLTLVPPKWSQTNVNIFCT